MSMFTIRQKLLLCGSVLISALLIAGSYFGSRWLHGPDVDPLPEHLLSDRPPAVSMNRPVRASVSQYTPSIPEADFVSEDESFSDTDSPINSDGIDDDLDAQLASLSDEDFTDLADALAELEQDEGESSDYPAIPDGFPLTPVWLKDFFDENLHADFVIIDRVLIELWNQGDHNLVNGIRDKNTGKVYPIYHGVVYVEWDGHFREDSNGQPLEVPYISYRLGISSTVEPLLNADGNLFTQEQIMSGAYAAMYPDVEFVDYSNAGYDPATMLNDY